MAIDLKKFLKIYLTLKPYKKNKFNKKCNFA